MNDGVLLMQTRADLAASFQRTAITHLTERCRRAVAWAKQSHPQVQTMVVAGGVACNQMLRDSLEQVTQEADWQLVCPRPSLCTDNGVMVAWAGVERSELCSSITSFWLQAYRGCPNLNAAMCVDMVHGSDQLTKEPSSIVAETPLRRR